MADEPKQAQPGGGGPRREGGPSGPRREGGPGGGPGGPRRGKRQYFRKKKVCKFCVEKMDFIDYKKADILAQFVQERGKILPRRMTGVCSRHQRWLGVALKRARNIALMPFAGPAAGGSHHHRGGGRPDARSEGRPEGRSEARPETRTEPRVEVTDQAAQPAPQTPQGPEGQ